MTILPLNPAEHRSPEALHAFLAQCRDAARSAGRAKLVSISITVDALDPLAVLESIFEPDQPHFYCERTSALTAIAGAEAAVAMTADGAGRFEAVQRFADETFEHTIAVGDVHATFGGPHVFAAFSFFDDVSPDEPFPAAQAFVPRWQVARVGEATTAVANLLVSPDADLSPLTERVWRAHAKFRRFDYAPASPSAAVPAFNGREPLRVSEEGDYRASVSAALRRIGSGDFNKIVLARARDVTAPAPLPPLQLLNGLRQRFPDCHAFSVANGRGDSFIGATPERLIRVRDGILETEALAGTTRRGRGAAEDAALGAALLHSDKNRREQAVVLESIRRRLAPLGLQLKHPGEPALLRLANVQHLHTPIKAQLPENVRLLDALARLHPTPAVGGSPREVAVTAIRELEAFPRGLYAGAVGWLDARGGGEFVVGIRSALVRGTTARVYAGAGIVSGSDPEKEFNETDLKFRALLDALMAGG